MRDSATQGVLGSFLNTSHQHPSPINLAFILARLVQCLSLEGLMRSWKHLELSNINHEWELVRLAMELKGLRRERQHLVTKSAERELTEWENRRLNAVEKEACEILMEIVNSKAPLQRTA